MLLRLGALLAAPFSATNPPILFDLEEQKIKVIDNSLVSFNVLYHAKVQELEQNKVQQINVSLVSSSSIIVSKETDYTMSVPNGVGVSGIFEAATTIVEPIVIPTISTLATQTERILAISTDGVTDRFAAINSTTKITTSSREETGYFPVKFDFDLFQIKAILEDDIKIVFSCVDSSGIEVFRKESIIPLNQVIDNLLYPLQPPKLEASYAIEDGFLDLLITQQDPNAYGIQLYKKELNNLRSSWELVKDVLLGTEKKMVLIKDRSNSTNVYEYRAISYNQNNVSGFGYSSITAELSKKPKASKLIKLEDNISISWNYSEEFPGAVKINVNNIPVTATAIALISKDLLIENSELYITPSGFIPMNGNTNETISFFDRNCFENHVYEYTIKIQYINGSQRLSEARCVVPYRRLINNIVKTNLTITKEKIDDDLLIIGNIETNFIEHDEGLIKNALSNGGLLGFFDSDFTKEKLNAIIAYEIYRKNLYTNKIEYLGTTTKTSFNDKEQSKIFSCQPAKSGFSYEYKVFSFIRNSFGILTETTKQIENLPTESFKPWFWQRPRVLNTGTLSTIIAEAQNFAGSVFSQGNLVDVVTTEISTEDAPPSVSEFQYHRLPLGFNKLTWTIVGDNSKIDSFMVYGFYREQKVFLGNAHSFSGNKRYSLLFKKINEINFQKFRLIPNYNNHNSGTEVELII